MNIQMPVPRDGPYSRETHVGLFPAAAAAGAATFFIFLSFFLGVRREPRFDPPRYNKAVVVFDSRPERRW